MSHSILIKTLSQYNIHPLIVTWVKHFLKDRKQQVIINNSLSTPLHVFSGVPQGSIIGPLLFNIYFNDSTLCSSTLQGSGNIMLFADDAKLFSTNSHKLQLSLDTTNEWLQSRQLNFATHKCLHLQISSSSSQPSDFYLNNSKISQCAIMKDLGVFISHDLKWAHHVNHLFKIGSLTSYQILKSFKSKNIWTLLKLYTTYVRPKLEYNSPIWNPHLKKDVLKIESVQRSFTRRACLRCGVPFSSYRDRLF